MKNKNLYILIPLVLVIWGILIFKFLESIKANGAIAPTEDAYLPEPKLNIDEEQEIVRLHALEKDPFLGIRYQRGAKKKIPTVPSIKKKNVQWPPIMYLGAISNTKNSQIIHIINFDGEQVLLKQGEAHKQITLTRSERDKIWLRYQGASKVFIK